MISPPSKKDAPWRAGANGNRLHVSTPFAPRGLPISDWLNPRRRRHAGAVVRYLAWHGRKVRFTRDVYADLRDDEGMDRYAVDQAVDDLYALGCVLVRQSGDCWAVELLDDDIDRLARRGPR